MALNINLNIKKQQYKLGFIIAALAGMVSYSTVAAELNHLSGNTMGQSYRISWQADELAPEQREPLRRSINGTLSAIDGTMSTWRDKSEVSRFNHSKSVEPIPVSDHTAAVIGKALQLGQQTNGALDITIGPLLKLWGFGPHRSSVIPSAQTRQQVLSYSGLDQIELNQNQLRKLDPRVEIDLSAIAKGYGVDQAALVLERYGINNYLVEIGGEVRTKGGPDAGKPWQVAVNQPAVYSTQTAAILNISGQSVATSGDYRQFYSDNDGQRYSHIVDPRNGDAKVRDVASATVVSNDCTSADGLATALMVMGIDDALAFAEQQQLSVLLIGAKQGQFSVHYSSQMAQFITP